MVSIDAGVDHGMNLVLEMDPAVSKRTTVVAARLVNPATTVVARVAASRGIADPFAPINAAAA